MRRTLVPFFVLLAVAALCLPPHSRALPLRGPGQSAFGINSHMASRHPDPSNMATPATLLAQVEAGWVREDFQFHRIMPKRGQFDWTFHDRAIDQLAARGINIIGILNGPTPGWAVGRQGNDFYAPDPQAFAAFARAVVARYKDRVRHWEVWNEPDNRLYWKPNPDPVAYANLLTVTSAAIKAVDPGALVLSAGLVTPEPAVSFLTTIANSGAWGAFDIISIHPYTDPKGPEEGQIAAAGVGQVKALAARLGPKPIWATEFGWSTGKGGRGGVAFDEETQANYLVRSMALLRAAGAERILWYKLKDNGSDEQYGIVRFGAGLNDYGALKPSAIAFKTLNQQLAGADGGQLLDLGGRELLVDFETFGTWKRGNQANGTLTPSNVQVRGGAQAAQLAYSFPSRGNDYVVFTTPSGPTLGPGTSQLGLWIYGDGSGHALRVWLRDAQGETLQFRLGFVPTAGWQFLSAPITGPVEPHNRVSGGGNGRLDLPARLAALVLDDEPDGASGTGTIFLDDITAIRGAEAYAVRFTKPGGSVDLVWSPTGGEVRLPALAPIGTLTNRDGATRPISATDGLFVLNAGPSPLYLEVRSER